VHNCVEKSSNYRSIGNYFPLHKVRGNKQTHETCHRTSKSPVERASTYGSRLYADQRQKSGVREAPSEVEGNGVDTALDEAPPKATLTFKDISSRIAASKGKPEKIILSNVSGSASPGRLLAVCSIHPLVSCLPFYVSHLSNV
jgi:hypothetical protein